MDIDSADETDLAISQQQGQDAPQTQATEPDDKLGDAIEQAFEQAQTDQQDRPRDDAGRFARAKAADPAADPTKPGDQGQPNPDQAQQDQGQAIEAPAAWKSAARADLWKGLSPDAQKALAEREAEVNAGFKIYDGLGGYARICHANGTTLAQAMGSYRAVEELLQKDFGGGIRAICQQFGVDPAKLVEALNAAPPPQAQQQQTPDIGAIVDQRLRETRAQDDVVSYWQKNPKAEEVAGEMLAVIQARRAAGRPVTGADLPEIYEEARYLNPATRDALIKEREEAARKQALGTEQKAAHKAQKLARSVGTAAPSASPGRGKKPSLDDAISAAWDTAESVV